MNRSLAFISSLTILTLFTPRFAQALTFVQPNVQPVYQFVMFAGTNLNPGASDVTLDFQALGNVELTIDDAALAAHAANPSLPIPLAAAYGLFQGELPGGTPLPAGTPFTLRAFKLLSGQLEHVTTNGQGAITGADATFTLLFDKIVAPGTPNELRLFGDQMTFTGEIESVPFSVGTSFVSPAPVPLRFDDGSASGVQVGLVQNRFLNVIPEPSSWALCVPAALSVFLFRRK